MSSPWAKIAAPAPVGLDEIMSEQLAKDLQSRDLNKLKPAFRHDVPPELEQQPCGNDCDSDTFIAMVLQREYDKEYDELLARSESSYNGTSKVSVSFDNYRRVKEMHESDTEEDEVEDVAERRDWDRFDTNQRELASIPPCGYKVTKDGQMITKHDVTLSGRRNACKMLSFPPEFQTGDGAGFDLKLSNKVFNSLKMHSKHEQARRHRIHDKKEDHATAEFGLDPHTRLLLFKLIENQVLAKVNGSISVGKEAVILHADSDPSCPKENVPPECAIKVFKTTLSEFKQRDKYIRDDYRFKDRIGKQRTRKIMHLWAEKEMHNLVRLEKAGIPCPHVVQLKDHVLIMSFVGKGHRPAPKLKDAKMDAADYIIAYDQVTQAMKDLYNKANLIHADLSEYNILWNEGQCYIIDVSQAVEPAHENAFHFLKRDCENVTNFFNRKGTEEVMTPDELFEKITGCTFSDKVSLLHLAESAKIKPHNIETMSGMGENVWEKAKKEVEENIAEKCGFLVEETKA